MLLELHQLDLKQILIERMMRKMNVFAKILKYYINNNFPKLIYNFSIFNGKIYLINI